MQMLSVSQRIFVSVKRAILVIPTFGEGVLQIHVRMILVETMPFANQQKAQNLSVFVQKEATT